MGGRKKRVGSGCAGATDTVIINHIMLKYRPIAPRPVSAESSGEVLMSKVKLLAKKSWKRKYVRVKRKEKKATRCNLMTVEKLSGINENNWISFNISGTASNCIASTPALSSHGADLAEKLVLESWITVVSVRGCEIEGRLGYTDDEIWKNLERDSCPGFISNNNCDEVHWMNVAYRRMVDPNPDTAAEVVVRLGAKMEKSMMLPAAFSCRVRIWYRVLEKETVMTVPCDVWKMDFGGFAWRLDVQAALSLGPLNSPYR